ncbi:MAG: CHAT domain-containing protein, partial [Sphingomonadaceae bacterium]|nr:CHAT domain-containing protein [Sphingomonadaceae bacterium]
YNYALSLLGQGKAEESLPLFEEALPLQLAEEQSGMFRFSAQDDTIILLTTLARARAQVAGQELAGFEAAREASERLRARQRARLDRATQTSSPSAAIAKAMARGNRRDPLASAYDMALFAGWAAREFGAEPYDYAFRAAQDLTLNDAGNAISDAAARSIAGAGPLGDLVRERQDVAAAIVTGTEAFRSASLGTDTAAAAELRARIDTLGARLAGLDAQLEQDFPGYRDLVAPQSIAVADLQQLLGPDEALLMTLPSEGAQYVFAISATGSGWHKVEGGAAFVGKSVDRLKCRIDEATCSVAELDAALAVEERSAATLIDTYYPRFDRAAAHELYQRLVAPVADVLPKGGRVYTVTSGPIAGLPLPVLVVSPPAGDPESGEAEELQATDWLGRHFAFVSLPSVSALRLARMRQGAAAEGAGQLPLVAYGAPVLLGAGDAAARGGQDGRRKRGGANARAADLTAIVGGRTMASVEKLRRLDPLPGTLAELRSLAASIGRGSGARVGSDATESAVKADRDLPRAETVVFATHGLLPNELGLGSEPGLVLTPPVTASALDDGLLTASEAAALSLSARWVVLSACNTATPASSESGGESLSSLARSFLYAGARNLLASHWRVADDATATLTAEVLTNREATPARALATAMDTIRSGRRPDGSAVEGWQPHWAHPASWAPFTLITNRDGD